MTIQNHLSLEALMAEEGMFISAGLPEGVRRELERRKAAKQRAELARAKREQVDQILASISQQQTCLAQLQDKLREAINEYTALTIDTAAA